MYDDRLATAYDPVQDTTLFRNLGRVDKYGLDGSIAWRPTAETLLYVFGSVTKSEIKNDLLNGTCSQDAVDAGQFDCTVVGDPAYIQLAGKRESGAPRSDANTSELQSLMRISDAVFCLQTTTHTQTSTT